MDTAVSAAAFGVVAVYGGIDGQLRFLEDAEELHFDGEVAAVLSDAGEAKVVGADVRDAQRHVTHAVVRHVELGLGLLGRWREVGGRST